MSITEEKLNQPFLKSIDNYDVLDIVGGDGPWQRQIFFVLFFITIPSAAYTMAIIFMAPEVDYWCARPSSTNISVDQWKSVGLPENDNQCSMYAYSNQTSLKRRYNDTKTAPCDSWEYENSFYRSTIVSKWNLVCGREWLVSLSESVYMSGGVVGGIASGFASDKIGRRPTTVACCVLMIISAIVCIFSTSLEVFTTTRFFISFGMGGFYYNLYILMMEVLNPNERNFYGNLVTIAWSIGYLILAVISWIARDWYWIQVSLTVPALVFLGVWWMIPESPRWLLSQGRLEEAKAILIKAATRNGRTLAEFKVPLENVLSDACKKNESGETEGTFLDMLKTPGLRRITLILFYIWLVMYFVYFGLFFNNEVIVDLFLNFSLLSIVEIPAILFSIFAIKYFGKKTAGGGALIAAGLICLSSYFAADIPWLSVALSLIGKFFITSVHGVMLVLSAEVLPTVVRNTGLGWCSFFGDLGCVISPFVHELHVHVGPFAPFAVFGILSLTSGVLIFTIPKAENCDVPDTFLEVLQMNRKNSGENLSNNQRRNQEPEDL